MYNDNVDSTTFANSDQIESSIGRIDRVSDTFSHLCQSLQYWKIVLSIFDGEFVALQKSHFQIEPWNELCHGKIQTMKRWLSLFRCETGTSDARNFVEPIRPEVLC